MDPKNSCYRIFRNKPALAGDGGCNEKHYISLCFVLVQDAKMLDYNVLNVFTTTK